MRSRAVYQLVKIEGSGLGSARRSTRVSVSEGTPVSEPLPVTVFRMDPVADLITVLSNALNSPPFSGEDSLQSSSFSPDLRIDPAANTTALSTSALRNPLLWRCAL